MTAVAGRRMAETVARRGGLAVLPQDIPLDVVESVDRLRQVPPPGVRDADHAVARRTPIGDALGLIHKRAHGAVVVVDDDGRPVGVFTEHDAAGFDRFTQLQQRDEQRARARSTTASTPAAGLRAARRRSACASRRWSTATAGWSACITRKGALRSTIYRPAVDADGRLLIAVAVGINGDPAAQGQGAGRRWASTCS